MDQMLGQDQISEAKLKTINNIIYPSAVSRATSKIIGNLIENLVD